MKFKDTFGILDEQQKAAIESLLERYRGPLSIPQIAAGIEVTLANARDLYQDGIWLLSGGRVARCTSLLAASLEEIGKVSVLAGMSRIPHSNQGLWSDAWESFRRHEHKSTWGFLNTYADESRSD